jgi:methionyl-tRNA synthetase
MEDLKLNEAIAHIWELINFANKYIEESKPWILTKQKDARLNSVIYNLVEVLRIVSISIWPFMPITAESILKQLGLSIDFRFDSLKEWGLSRSGVATNKGKPLFPRIE